MKGRDNLKPINGYCGYYIDENGNIYSSKSGTIKQLIPYETKHGYMMIGLINDFGIRKKVLIHRIVAETFIKNPNHLPEVDHIDNNPQNNRVENLQWITRKGNLKRSYKTMSPIRNYNKCDLYKGDKYIKSFKSITAACKYAQEQYGSKRYQLEKNLWCKDVKIIPYKKTRKNLAS